MKKAIAVALMVVVIATAALVVSRSGLFNRPAPSATPSASKLSQAKISALISAWTYPGAKDTTSTLKLPPRLGSVANPWPKYIRRFVTASSPARVRRFYALKLGVAPAAYEAGTNSWGIVPSGVMSYAMALEKATALPTAPREMDGGNFTRTTKNCMIEAMISGRPRARQTQVILLLVPLSSATEPMGPPQDPNPYHV